MRKAFLLSSCERYVSFALFFVILSVVSRLLTPTEIGIAVVGLAITTVAAVLREFASLNYVIQKPDLGPKDACGAFTVMFLLSAVIAVTLALAAPHLARAMEMPELTPFFRVVAAAMLLEVFSTLVATLLQRELSFGKVATINLAASGTNAVTVIYLAYSGFSFMSYAWGWLAAASVGGLVALALRPDLSVFRPSLAVWRGMLRFGVYNGMNGLLFRLFEQAPYAALGRAVAPEAAGLFHRAVAVSQLPQKALSGVAVVLFPAFSMAVRAGEPLAPLYLRGIAMMTALVWPAYLFLAIMAEPIVAALLGPQWQAAGPIIQIVAIALLFTFSAELNYCALVSIGAIRDIFLRALLVFLPGSVIASTAAVMGGLQAVALSFIVIHAFNAAVGLSLTRRRLGFTWVALGQAIRPSLVITALTMLGPLTLVTLDSGLDAPIAEAALAAGLALLGWVFAVRMVDHPFADEARRLIRLAPDRLRAMARPAETGQ